MRTLLSERIVASAISNPQFVVLSGDHGYALFDALRAQRPNQFLNVGIAEQAMVGYAAGLAKTGFRPLVYGLSAFVPLRVLEQIKLDVCYPALPVIFLGDGAGLVYSTLGSSHQCGEDIACLRPLPNIAIYSPCDAYELATCFDEALHSKTASYIRIGKSDRPAVNLMPPSTTEPYFTHESSSTKLCVISSGSLVSVAKDLGEKLDIPTMSVPRIQPFPQQLAKSLLRFQFLVILEEHSRFGGLFSSLAETMSEMEAKDRPRFFSLSLKNQFAEKCGSYQYALAEHALSDRDIERRLLEIIHSIA